MYTDGPGCRRRPVSDEADVGRGLRPGGCSGQGAKISAEAISSQMPGFYTVEVVVGLLGELKAAGVELGGFPRVDHGMIGVRLGRRSGAPSPDVPKGLARALSNIVR